MLPVNLSVENRLTALEQAIQINPGSNQIVLIAGGSKITGCPRLRRRADSGASTSQLSKADYRPPSFRDRFERRVFRWERLARHSQIVVFNN